MSKDGSKYIGEIVQDAGMLAALRSPELGDRQHQPHQVIGLNRPGFPGRE